MGELLQAGTIPPGGIGEKGRDSDGTDVYLVPKRDQPPTISSPDRDAWLCVQEILAYQAKIRESEGFSPSIEVAAEETGWGIARYFNAMHRPYVQQQLATMLRGMAVATLGRIHQSWYSVLDAQIAVASNPDHPGTTRAAQWLAGQIERLQDQVEEKQDTGKGGKSRALALLDQLRAKAGQVTATEVTRTVTIDVESAE